LRIELLDEEIEQKEDIYSEFENEFACVAFKQWYLDGANEIRKGFLKGTIYRIDR